MSLLKPVLIHILLAALCSLSAFSQVDSLELSYDDELYMNELLTFDSLLLEEFTEDSTLYKLLFDSLDAQPILKNSISLRLGYNSSILNAGRNFGFEQYGLSGGATYYHSTGLFADISGFWNSDFEPNYNLTTTSLGYMGFIGKKISYTASYDHFFYRYPQNDSINYSYPLTSALNGNMYIDFHNINFGIDYQYLFGDETAHRLRFNAFYYFKKETKGFFNKVTFAPGVSVLMGNSSVYYFSQESTLRDAIESFRDEVGNRRFLQLYRNNRERFRSEVESRMFTEGFNSVFGIMNYSINIPFSVFTGRSTLSVFYNINIPVALPGETIDTSSNIFFGINYFYNLYF